MTKPTYEELEKRVNERERIEIELNELKEALVESNKRYKALYNNALVAMFRTSIKDGKALAVNEVGARLFGYISKDEFISEFKAPEHYVDPGARGKLLNQLKLKGEVENYQMRLARKDGSTFWAEFSARIYPKEGYFECVVIDITERKNIEEALKVSEARFRSTLDSMCLRDARLSVLTGATCT